MDNRIEAANIAGSCRCYREDNEVTTPPITELRPQLPLEIVVASEKTIDATTTAARQQALHYSLMHGNNVIEAKSNKEKSVLDCSLWVIGLLLILIDQPNLDSLYTI